MNLKRRDFLGLSAGFMSLATLGFPMKSSAQDKKAGAAALTDKQILKDGMPATIANYCENPDKQPNKACPAWKEGHCETCTFFNKNNTLTTYKGAKYAHCQLLADPTKPQFVAAKGWCATYVKQA